MLMMKRVIIKQINYVLRIAYKWFLFDGTVLWKILRYKKGVLKKFAEEHLCWSLFSNKVTGFRPATLLKERIQHRCFPVNFEKLQVSIITTSQHSLNCINNKRLYKLRFNYKNSI